MVKIITRKFLSNECEERVSLHNLSVLILNITSMVGIVKRHVVDSMPPDSISRATKLTRFSFYDNALF